LKGKNLGRERGRPERGGKGKENGKGMPRRRVFSSRKETHVVREAKLGLGRSFGASQRERKLGRLK